MNIHYPNANGESEVSQVNPFPVQQFGYASGKSNTAAANTLVTVAIAGTTGKTTVIRTLHMGFSGAAPAAPVQATITDGTTTLNFSVGTNSLNYEFVKGWGAALAANVTISLPAGGAGAIGNITVEYEQI